MKRYFFSLLVLFGFFFATLGARPERAQQVEVARPERAQRVEGNSSQVTITLVRWPFT